MNAAFTSYDESAGPGSGVTGGHKRLCGTTGTTTGTAAWRARPFHDPNKPSAIALKPHEWDIHALSLVHMMPKWQKYRLCRGRASPQVRLPLLLPSRTASVLTASVPPAPSGGGRHPYRDAAGRDTLPT